MYERFFGLADTPFRLTPDPRYLFLSPKHAEALAHLKLGLRESSGFVCITGDVGTGKTTLLRAFLADLGPETATAYIFNPPLSALELLKTINGELGLFAATRSRKKLVDAPPRIFTRPALRLVHRISRGVPRVVNMVAHRAMVVAFAAERRVVNAACVRQAYREIGALPLAAAARASPRRTAWAAAAVGACVGVIALGVVALAWRPELRLGGASESPPPSIVATPPEETPAPEVAVATPPSEVAVETPPSSTATGSAGRTSSGATSRRSGRPSGASRTAPAWRGSRCSSAASAPTAGRRAGSSTLRPRVPCSPSSARASSPSTAASGG